MCVGPTKLTAGRPRGRRNGLCDGACWGRTHVAEKKVLILEGKPSWPSQLWPTVFSSWAVKMRPKNALFQLGMGNWAHSGMLWRAHQSLEEPGVVWSAVGPTEVSLDFGSWERFLLGSIGLTESPEKRRSPLPFDRPSTVQTLVSSFWWWDHIARPMGVVDKEKWRKYPCFVLIPFVLITLVFFFPSHSGGAPDRVTEWRRFSAFRGPEAMRAKVSSDLYSWCMSSPGYVNSFALFRSWLVI